MKKILLALLLVSVSAQAQVARVVTNGLLAYAPMESDSLAFSLGNYPTAVSGTKVVGQGVLGNSLVFTNSSFLIVSNLPSFTASGSLTVAGWFKLINAPTTIERLFLRPNPSPVQQYFIDFRNNLLGNSATSMNLAVCCYVGASAFGVVSRTDFLPVSKRNIWHHFAGVWNNTVYSIYINGVLDNTATTTACITDTNGATLIHNNGSSCAMDDVRIYNRALSATEISSLYYSRRPSPQ